MTTTPAASATKAAEDGTAAPTPRRHGHSSGSRFQLHIQPTEDGGDYAIALEETNRPPGHTRQVAFVATRRRPGLMWPINDALSSSNHPRGALHGARRRPILLDDAAGVRLALACQAVDGITKPGRTTALLEAISRLSEEECFYWYAHTQRGDDATRRRKRRALRTFLAD